MVTFYEERSLYGVLKVTPMKISNIMFVFNLIICSIYIALVQACHISPQVAHVCTIA
jgi:hypothetical protein